MSGESGSIRAHYYAVTINTLPFEFGKEKEIGCYASEGLAKEVVALVNTTFHGRVNGGLDLGIRDYVGEIVDTAGGLRLKETPRGAIILIKKALTAEEVQQILRSVSREAGRNLIETPSTTNRIDEPKYIYEGRYYCVILSFEPFDHSNELIAGYYQSHETAYAVSRLIHRTHQSKATGCGFDMDIVPYQGRFVEYASGERRLMIDGKSQEIKSSCDMDEAFRLGKVVGEAMKKWC